VRLELNDIIVQTAIAHAGCTVEDIFTECMKRRVGGLPYRNDDGEIVGKVSVRHTLKETCVPDYMVKGAHILGDELQAVRMSREFIDEVLTHSVEQYVLKDYTVLPPNAPLIKALATFEQNDTEYVFVMDGSNYLGAVTRIGIVQLMLERHRT